MCDQRDEKIDLNKYHKAVRIFRGVDRDFHDAVAAWAYYVAANGPIDEPQARGPLRKALRDTLEANAYNYLRVAAAHDAALAISRVVTPYSKRSKDVASIGTLLKIWEDDDTKKAILESSLRQMEARGLKDHIERYLWVQINAMKDLEIEYQSFLAGDNNKTIREFRTVFLAHTLTRKPATLPTFPNVKMAIEEIGQLYRLALLGLRCSDYSPERLMEQQLRVANRFWDTMELGLSERQLEKARKWLWRRQEYGTYFGDH